MEFTCAIAHETLEVWKDLLQEPHANPNAANWAKPSFLIQLTHSMNTDEIMRYYNVHLGLWEQRPDVQRSLSPPVISNYEWGVKHSICLT